MLLSETNIRKAIEAISGVDGVLILDDQTLDAVAAKVKEVIDAPDDPMSEMFPDDDQLAMRRKAFIAKIVDYIDPSKRVVSDGGWTPATWDDVHAFDKLVTELRDLRYGRDGDADATIVWKMCPRTEGRQHWFFEPYEPEARGDEPVSAAQKAEYNETIVNVASRMIGTAEDLLRMHAHRVRQEQKAADTSREREIDYSVFRRLVEMVPHPVPFETAKASYIELLKKYKGDLALREISALLAEKIDPMLVSIAATVDDLIEKGDLAQAKTILEDTFKTWFGGVLKPQRDRWNEAQAKIRKAARAAGQKPPAWSQDYIGPTPETEPKWND